MILNIDIPEGTDNIFYILRRGGYLCANHPDEKHSSLYSRCEKKKEGLKDFFKVLGYGLVGEDGYYYLEDLHDGNSEDSEIDKKLSKYLPLINFYFVLKKIYPRVSIGTIFSLAEVEQTVINSIPLSSKYRATNKDGIRKAIEKDVKMYISHGYIHPISASDGRFMILTSFTRLLDFLSLISFGDVDEIEDEMRRETEIKEEQEND